MKKQINNVDDIIYYVAKECNVSQEVVREVYNNLWLSVRYCLSNPLKYGNIMLNTFIKFTISEPKTYKYVKKLRNKEGRIPERKSDISFYEKLFEIASGETFDQRTDKIKQREWQKTNQEKE